MRVIAHRGASAEAPENTLASFRRALTLGVEMIELDVRLTADGVPVVIHDEDLSRTTDGEGRVEDLDFSAIRRFSAGRWFGEAFEAERVPSLAEVYDLVCDRAEINAEIKGRGPGTARFALRAAGEAGALERTLFSAFDPDALRAIRAASAGARLALLSDAGSLADPRDPAPRTFRQRLLARLTRVEDLALEAANLQHLLADRAAVAALRERGLRVYVFTVDGVRAVEALERIGVDGVFANDPAPLLARWPPPSP